MLAEYQREKIQNGTKKEIIKKKNACTAWVNNVINTEPTLFT